MKMKLFLIGTIAAGIFANWPAEADYSDHYMWNGKSWIAKSTSGLEHIIQNGDEITFNFLTDRCLEDIHKDCYYKKLRSQLGEKYGSGEYNNKSVRYTFSVKKEKRHGANMKLWELKPFGGNTWTVPTIAITQDWININHINGHGHEGMVSRDYNFPHGVWNHFIVDTKQSPNDDGYVVVKMNGEIVFNYRGKTTWNHRFSNDYIFGPYICCGNQSPNEPNHKLAYKNITKYVH
jgi:hypothetical protein